jgi:hypothetical protein
MSTYIKKNIPKKIKELVWDKYIGEKYGTGICLCCNETLIKQMSFHCGHVKSEKNGGDSTLENLRPICASCNLSMGTRNMNEFMETYNLSSNVNKNINSSIDTNHNYNIYEENNNDILNIYANANTYTSSSETDFKKNILVNAYLNKYENKFSRK